MRRTEKLYSIVTPIWTKEMGRRLAVIRMRRLWTQKELSYALRTPDEPISQQTIHSLERGNVRVITISLARIRAVIGEAYIGYLLFGEGADRFNVNDSILNYWRAKLRRKPKIPR